MEDESGVTPECERYRYPSRIWVGSCTVVDSDIYSKWSTAEVSSSRKCQTRKQNSTFNLSSMKTHKVLIILVIDTRVLGCAYSLQERRFASISPTDLYTGMVLGVASESRYISLFG